jgi:hypothetical protein
MRFSLWSRPTLAQVKEFLAAPTLPLSLRSAVYVSAEDSLALFLSILASMLQKDPVFSEKNVL